MRFGSLLRPPSRNDYGGELAGAYVDIGEKTVDDMLGYGLYQLTRSVGIVCGGLSG